MGKKKTKLELTWIGKEDQPRLEPRILIEDPDRSYHASHRVSENDVFDNMLIFGDNLLALKALEQEYTGRVKCIFIDPPYNTGSAFSHYDDGIEHSLWLSLLRDRLYLLKNLLSTSGSIWITIDDSEGHYLKVLCDEVFSRLNYIGTVTWQKTTSVHNNATLFSSATDMILVYASNIEEFEMGRIPRNVSNIESYKNPDNDPRGPWTSSPLHVSLTSGQRGRQFAKTGTSSGLFPIINPHGDEVMPPKGRCWGYSRQTIDELQNDGRIWWGTLGNNQPRLKRFLAEIKEGVVPTTLWISADVGHNQEAKLENSNLLPNVEELFSTPKPERLLQQILTLASDPGDLVLDSFAGSGTTGAVAHKMGRRWIMVELGENCHTHIIPRLKKVINGEDPGGITESVDWKGGGGFRYFKLGPSLIVKDEWGNPVINKEFNPAMLAEAMCKLEGFDYAPSDEHYWIHGKSTETDFIYVTTQFMSREMLTKISDEVGPERSLLICCSAFRANPDQFPNLTIQKIPKAVLKKCEWGRDDYSLEIKELPEAPRQPDVAGGEPESTPGRKFGKDRAGTGSLFDTGDAE